MTSSQKVKIWKRLCLLAAALPCVSASPAAAQDSLKQAVAMFNKGDFSSCTALLNRDINGSLKSNATAHYYLGTALLRLNQNNAAAEHYLATSKLAPGTVYDDYSRKALKSIMGRAGNMPHSLKEQYQALTNQGSTSQTAASNSESTKSNYRQSEDDDQTLPTAALKDIDSTFISAGRRTADTDRALIQVCRAVKLVPKTIVDELKAGGISVLVTPTILEAMPGSAMEKPRGYDHGGGYTNCGAMFHHPRIYIGERVSYLSSVPYPNRNIASSMLHEMGHAYDSVKGHLSQTGEFERCYKEDFSHITNTQRTRHSYYTQSDGAGASELFAQLFSYAIYKTQVRADEDASDLQVTFPRCTKYIKDLIKSNR
ncbi:MAG: hypothetical protein HY986_04935 [Candidatus Melainabacteria bacterium]|nr:hypothetical protein [Candidatus Melainabacteria bacterium]